MPIYEYQCHLCNHQLEALQKTSDEALTVCPACNKEGLVKLISAASFQLKGTGWYATDFRDKKAATAETNKTTKEEGNSNTVSSSETSTKNDSTSGNNGEAA